MTERPGSTRSRLHRHGTLAIATLLFTGVLVASDVGVGGSATPPAELISEIVEVGDSFGPSISGDGSRVAFDFNDWIHDGSTQLSKVRDRATSTTGGVPFADAANDDQFNTVISRDGCHLAYTDSRSISFGQTSYTAIELFVANRCAATPTTRIYVSASSTSSIVRGVDISDHGRYVTIDNGGTVLWFDRDADADAVFDEGPPVQVTSSAQTSGGDLGDETLTRRVAISSLTSGYSAQVFLWDPMLSPNDPSARLLVSATDGTLSPDPARNAYDPSMTPDGRFVAYVTTDDYPGGTYKFPDQVVVRDTSTNRTALVSRTAANAPGNLTSWQPSITADGTQIAFSTYATDLLAPGPGGVFGESVGPSFDLLVATSVTGFYATVALDRVSLKPNGDAINTSNGELEMQNPTISSSGRWVAFQSSYAAELRTGADTVSSAGVFVPRETDVYVMARPPTVVIDPLDFGSVAVGSVSAVLTTTVTNVGNSSLLPTSFNGDGDFMVVAGGTCVPNTWLSPGESCTVPVQFAPSATGPRSSLLRMVESGFGAFTATGALGGSGFVVPVQTTTTTAPTTTTTGSVAPTTTTKPPTTTAPPVITVPRTQKLVITPDPASFGTTMVGVATAPIVFAVSSTGTGSATIDSVSVGGADASAFVITADECQGLTLSPGASCALTVQFVPDAPGARSAILSASAGSASATADLDGVGTLQPSVRLLPNVVTAGEVTIAVGAGFPPDTPVQFRWLDGSDVFSGTTDAFGAIQVHVPVRPDEMPGPRTFVAVDQPGSFSGVATDGLVVDPSASPPTSRNPASPELASLVVRN